MKHKSILRLLSILSVSCLLIVSCSKDKDPLPDLSFKAGQGVYVLNEGAREQNNSSLSFIDFSDNRVASDVYKEVNGQALGEIANDMEIYGSMLFILVDRSNKVDILDAQKGKLIKSLNIEGPRSIAFHSGKAFITSLSNKVYVLDTLSKTFVKEIPVGRSPEQIVTSGNRLYVVNSGWADALTGGAHDNRLFIINPSDYSTEAPITISDNLTNVFADGRGNVYAATTDIYSADWSQVLKPSRLYKINTSTKAVEELAFGADLMTFHQNSAFLLSYNYEPGKARLLEMDLSSGDVKAMEHFESQNLSYIYSLEVNPDNGDIWMGTTDYTNPGTVYRYNALRRQVSTFTVGLNPASFAFKK